MSNYNWCHGPYCHTQQTQSRVRGSGDNKVLRTIKIKPNRYGAYQAEIWNHFCNNRCLMDFIREHITSIIAIAPRREALETPIKVEKEKFKDYRMKWNENEKNYVQTPYTSTRTTIKSVDNA